MAAAEQRVALLDLAVDLDIFAGEFQQGFDFGGGNVGDRQKMLALEERCAARDCH